MEIEGAAFAEISGAFLSLGPFGSMAVALTLLDFLKGRRLAAQCGTLSPIVFWFKVPLEINQPKKRVPLILIWLLGYQGGHGYQVALATASLLLRLLLLVLLCRRRRDEQRFILKVMNKWLGWILGHFPFSLFGFIRDPML